MNQQIIIMLMPYIVPSAVALIIYICHLIFHALPQRQQDALKHLALLASPVVHSIEQLYTTAAPQDKKHIALEIIELSFQAIGLPMPDEKIVNAFIEAAVFEMNKLKGQS